MGRVTAGIRCLLIAALITRSLPAQGAAAAARRPSATITGVVFDSLASGPLAGANVQLVRDGAPGERALFETTTDSRGRFSITNVMPGSYAAGFFHPRLEAMGLDAPVVHVTLEAQRSTDLLLAIPALPALARALCHLPVASDSATLWVGTVRDAITRAPRAHGDVSVQWMETDITRGGIFSVRRSGVVPSDADGHFAVCNAPADATLFVRAAQGGEMSGVVVVRFPASRLLARDLVIGPSEPAGPDSVIVVNGKSRTIPSLRRGPASLTGSVRGPTGMAIAGARVHVAGASASAATGSDGAFELHGLPAGSGMLEVRALGFEPINTDVDLVAGPGSTNTKSVVLEKAFAALDTVRVIAGAADVLVKSGFTQRRQSSPGHFIDRATIQNRHATEVKNIMQDIPGMMVMPHVPGGGPSLLMKTMGQLCAPAIYVDGQRFSAENDAQDMLSTINPGTVAGIEVYNNPGQVPLAFGGTLANGCGVIVVWTDELKRARPKPAP